MSVKVWVTLPAELVAVIRSPPPPRPAPVVAVVGVPEMVAVPFPLAAKLTPAGRVPVSVRVGTG